ncbi:hypothetical protein EIN_118250 [Entamoeba invadens IP1]|uniref:Uncharacterized protein n=1 Tax=Entamoeba invadens IP1 TaxID=370355 RepID=L7FNQ4_ENTIV|nr:hypothetical protein EIN_118250 [Entamoeba invadens IP1]ELP92251.1 hypothetical protein EIN_118250 [Entamoeba invadens IP1]|eukprot:XP_004259022.1 hypothetical protein EIN_118250 [Entamoeba invadens IP1]
MSWETTQAVITIDGYHLDMGSDHHRSFQDILFRLCEYATICIRSASILESSSKQLPPEKYQDYVVQITEYIKELNDPLSKLYIIVERECTMLSHKSIQDSTQDRLMVLKDLTTNYLQKFDKNDMTSMISFFKTTLTTTFSVMKAVLSECSETLCDNCDLIIQNIEKTLLLEEDTFNQGSIFVASQIVNGIGLPLRYRKNSVCGILADLYDEVATRLTLSPNKQEIVLCKTLVLKTKDVFRRNVQDVTVKVEVIKVDKSTASLTVVPTFRDKAMLEMFSNDIEDQGLRESFVQGSILENVNTFSNIAIEVSQNTVTPEKKQMRGMEVIIEAINHLVDTIDPNDEVFFKTQTVKIESGNKSDSICGEGLVSV